MEQCFENIKVGDGYFIKKRRMIKKRCHKCTEFQKCNIKYDI